MKKLLLFIGAFIIFWSCEEDGMNYNFDTHLKKTITADVEESGLKASLFEFEVIDTLDLKDNEEIKKYIDRIKDISIDSATCSLSGIPENEEIIELNITFLETGTSIHLANLTENNNQFDLGITNSQLDSVSSYFYTNQYIIIKTDGKTTIAPMQLKIDLDFKAAVKASLL